MTCREEAQCLEEFLLAKQIPFTKDSGSASTRSYLADSDEDEEEYSSSESGAGRSGKRARLGDAEGSESSMLSFL